MRKKRSKSGTRAFSARRRADGALFLMPRCAFPEFGGGEEPPWSPSASYSNRTSSTTTVFVFECAPKTNETLDTAPRSNGESLRSKR